jgi:hypothetical protein
MNTASGKLMSLFAAQASRNLPETGEFIQQISALLDLLKIWFVPVSTVFFFVFGLLLWFFLYYSFVRLMEKSYLITKKDKKKTEAPGNKKSASEERERRENDRRLFVHLISVLQKEGRLMDFFSEDLDDYEDEQIGAAVRTIHESCKKAIHKYLSADAVIDKDEDEEITVPPGFDPNAIKLTGNVTGEPPFKGVVRHRGWKITKLEMPTLSGSRNPNIIAPAEVEIL